MNIALLSQKYQQLTLVCHHTNIKGKDTAESMLRDIDRIRSTSLDTSLMSSYVREMWVSELNILDNENTVEICDALFEGKEAKEVKEMIKTFFPYLDAEKATCELQNLYNACNFLFVPESKINFLSIPFIQKINSIVMKDLLSSAGQFRVKDVTAFGCNVKYCVSTKIENELTTLCTFINNLPQHTTRDVIRRASFFFSEFLLIHPFEDGNGRTARLLLSYLLQSISTMPVSLYLDTNSRAIYLDALNARNDRRFPPEKVVSLVLTCVHRTLCDYQFLK